MSLSTVTTMGYSIAGGLQAGPGFIVTLGYGIGVAVEVVPPPCHAAVEQVGPVLASVELPGPRAAAYELPGPVFAEVEACP